MAFQKLIKQEFLKTNIFICFLSDICCFKVFGQRIIPTCGKSYLASSSDLVNYTKTLRIPQGCALLSFDVISFFTKVSTDLALKQLGGGENQTVFWKKSAYQQRSSFPFCSFASLQPTLGMEMNFMSRSMVQPLVLLCYW